MWVLIALKMYGYSARGDRSAFCDSTTSNIRIVLEFLVAINTFSVKNLKILSSRQRRKRAKRNYRTSWGRLRYERTVLLVRASLRSWSTGAPVPSFSSLPPTRVLRAPF